MQIGSRNGFEFGLRVRDTTLILVAWLGFGHFLNILCSSASRFCLNSSIIFIPIFLPSKVSNGALFDERLGVGLERDLAAATRALREGLGLEKEMELEKGNAVSYTHLTLPTTSRV